MSLINDALKKAEEDKRRRTDPGGKAAASAETRASPKRKMLRGVLFTMLLGGFAASALSLYLAASMLGEDPEPPRKTRAIAKAPEPSPTPEPKPEPQPEPMPEPDSPPKAPGREEAVEIEEPAVREETDPPAPVPEPVPPTAPATEEEAPPGPDPSLQDRVSGLRVRGVVSGGQRILLYDPAGDDTAALEPGDRLPGEPRLRLEKIRQNELHFIDPHGNRYTQFF